MLMGCFGSFGASASLKIHSFENGCSYIHNISQSFWKVRQMVWGSSVPVIFQGCRLDHLEWAHIYVSLHARSANNISGPICNMWFRILSRPTLAGMLYAQL